MTVHTTTLPNGLQIIAEELPQALSVAFGFFVRAGSRDEWAAVNGVSHFLEHMVFKGTEQISAEEVNRRFDDLGANYNASTGEETTMYYACVLPEYFREAFSLQAAILFPALRDADFVTEKQVILEEIGMYDDQPSFVAYDASMRDHFAGHPLGWTILGSRESVGALTAEAMRAYHVERYRAGNIVLAVAGKFDWEEVQTLANAACGHWPSGGERRSLSPAAFTPRRQTIVRPPLQQQTTVIVGPAPAAEDPRRYAAEVLSIIIGDDSTSRLYWELSDPGHADIAETSSQDFEGAGTMVTMLTSDPERAAENMAVVERIYADINRNGVTADELALAKTKAATRLALRGERPMGRLAVLGNDWLVRGEYRSVADDLRIVQQLTLADIRAVLDEFPLQMTTVVDVGPRG